MCQNYFMLVFSVVVKKKAGKPDSLKRVETRHFDISFHNQRMKQNKKNYVHFCKLKKARVQNLRENTRLFASWIY